VPDADDELAGGAVVLHVVMGLRHLLQAVVDAVHGEGQPAGRDRVEDLLQGPPALIADAAISSGLAPTRGTSWVDRPDMAMMIATIGR